MPARGAAVVAEMADVGGGVGVRRAAAEAVLRVGGVLERGTRLRRVVEAERDAARAVACEVADLRVVGVDDEHGVVGQRRDRGAPALGDLLQLAVAVELVAEEVARGTTARGRTRRATSGKRGLVHLEEAELRVARREERRGDSRDEVRARAVVREPDARARGSTRRTRPSSSSRSSPRRSPCPREAARRAPIERAGVDRGQDLARQRRAAAASGEARQPARRAGERDFQGQAHSAASLVTTARIPRSRESRPSTPLRGARRTRSPTYITRHSGRTAAFEDRRGQATVPNVGNSALWGKRDGWSPAADHRRRRRRRSRPRRPRHRPGGRRSGLAPFPGSGEPDPELRRHRPDGRRVAEPGPGHGQRRHDGLAAVVPRRRQGCERRRQEGGRPGEEGTLTPRRGPPTQRPRPRRPAMRPIRRRP